MSKTVSPVSFAPAVRTATPLKIGLVGLSGSGKSYSAILMALGLGERVAVLDLEGGSASLYSDLGTFDVASLEPPFTVPKVLEGIEAAIANEYSVLIVDGMSQIWRQLLMQKSVLDARPNANGFANWKPISQEYSTLIQSITNAPIHMIMTFRSKTAYLQSFESGRAIIKRVGTELEFRSGVEYELCTVLELDRETHEAKPLKDRSGLFEARVGKISRGTGQALRNWLAKSKATEEPRKEE